VIPEPCLTADELNRHLADTFDQVRPYRVVDVWPEHTSVLLNAENVMIRPGGTVSGPTVMGLADAAAWLVVLAHIGWVPLAVTSSLSINFLRKPEPGDLLATAELLKLGRRLAVIDVRVTGGTEGRLVADASVTYAIPADRSTPGAVDPSAVSPRGG
jgi:uncharacterized protein (TIGR00369 family)